MLASTMRVILVCVGGMLSACGGGGGGGNNAGSTGTIASAPSPTAPAPVPMMPAAVDFSPVAGLYDVSTPGTGTMDVSYLFITNQGAIEIYNDLNDTFAGAGAMNCFRRAVSGDVDFALDGKQLQLNGTVFQTTLTAIVSGMNVDSTLRLTPTAAGFSVNLAGASSGTGNLSFNDFNGLGRITLNGMRTTTISIETIRSMICR